MKRTAIFGPPGTGKTTRLMAIIEQCLEDNIPPGQIAFVSFTNAAVDEAKKRVAEKFGFKKADMHWFRTIHSLCYSLSKRPGQSVVLPSDLRTFSRLVRIAEYSGNPRRKERGDVALDAHHLSRSAGVSLKEAWMKCSNWYAHDFIVVEKFIKAYEHWKEMNGKVDFQDMIDNYLANPVQPDIQVSIIDEAQDLNSQQWQVVENTFQKSERQYIAGDDDQSIYTWSGSRVDKMLNYPADEKIVLEQSFRCPKSVHALASIILSRIKTREPKEWKPTKLQGQYKMYGEYSFVPFHKFPDESWFVLARLDYALDEVRWWLQSIGALYVDEQGYSIKRPLAKKIMTLKKLQQGEACLNQSIRNALWESLLNYNVLDLVHLKSKGYSTMEQCGIDLTGKDLVDAYMHKFESQDEYEYVKRAFLMNEDLLVNPNIELTTIHKAKGREADNVVVLLDQTGVIIDQAAIDPDNEHRNWYVAVTRAKKRLYTVTGKSVHNYKI